MMSPKRPALVALADGTVFEGHCVAGDGEVFGEMVFNTSMTGYQEILTDPSYAGQMVTMTYPHIGNYGVTPEDNESSQPHVRAFIMKQCCHRPSNQRATGGLIEYLEEHGVIGVEGIDTRQLTRHVRTEGAMKAAVSTTETEADALIERARSWEGLEGKDLAKEVTCADTYVVESQTQQRAHVVAFDFGMKRSIVRKLSEAGCPRRHDGRRGLGPRARWYLPVEWPGRPTATGLRHRNDEETDCHGEPAHVRHLSRPRDPWTGFRR